MVSRAISQGQKQNCPPNGYIFLSVPDLMVVEPLGIVESGELEDGIVESAGMVVCLIVRVGCTLIFWALTQASCAARDSCAHVAAQGGGSKTETKRVL